ncbi:alcohol dehydrogenase [Streptomyces antimycoticus]|uniref:2-deoxy-scyllo-inosamine dehydrogenase n=1 Tax=Streptomyces antimycoticus TaxID=68175 RepID=A0A499UZS0_9ACTN|nr:alcohol dehydrogenase catalytic domain-containing protein [Streptomyces antimycoticus]BBJ45578.1 alcohol dehydrogenase [Streptomyces antimycoticus]
MTLPDHSAPVTEKESRAPAIHQRQIRVTAPRRVALVERDLTGPPPPGEVRVRVREVGVCGSDLKMWSGEHAVLKPPLVLGHEAWGTVEEHAVAPDATGAAPLVPGTPVAIVPPAGCGTCHNCARGREQLCARMRFVGGQIDGAMARFLTVPPRHLLRIDPRVPEELRVLIEPLTVAVHAVSRARVAAGDQVLVIGAGPIGVFCSLVLAAQGVGHVVVTDRDPLRLDLAHRLGVPHHVRTTAAQPLLAAGDHIRSEGADVVFDCVGAQATTTQALTATCRGGRTVLVGISPAELTVGGVALQRGERELIGVQMYQREDFTHAMGLLAEGLVPAVDGLKRSRPLDRAGKLLDELARRPGPVLKETLLPD